MITLEIWFQGKKLVGLNDDQFFIYSSVCVLFDNKLFYMNLGSYFVAYFITYNL